MAGFPNKVKKMIGSLVRAEGKKSQIKMGDANELFSKLFDKMARENMEGVDFSDSTLYLIENEVARVVRSLNDRAESLVNKQLSKRGKK